jgi:ABC-type multidrug transport system fused ATPase/permease subunit
MGSLKRLFGMLGPYWKALTVTSVLILIGTGLSLIPPLLQGAVVDEVVGAQDLQRVAMLIGALILVYVGITLTEIGDQYIRHTVGERFLFDLRIKLYDHLQRLSLAFYDRTSTGELMSRVSNDVNALEQFITHGVILTVVDGLRLLGASVILLVLDWRLALVALLPVPLIAIALRRFNRNVRPIYRQVRDRLGDINSRLQDELAGMRVIQAFGQEAAEAARFTGVSRAYYSERVKAIRNWSTFFPAMSFIAAVGGALVLGFGAVLVVNEQISVGTLVAFMAYVVSFYDPIRRLTEVDNTFQQASAAADRIFELFDERSEVQEAADAIALPRAAGAVRFEDVHFRYGTGDEVLRDVTFNLAPGEVAALVGPSGAGKTSIASLLCRFYDPISGSIAIDGHILRDVTLHSIRQQVAVVLQDTFLFNATVRENLTFARPDATEDEILAATQAAFAHDFIMAMPQGYDTQIGERGVKLSGGQRQRLALARAILADPRILILDEATSSVDAEAEYLIQQALESVMQGRTALVIAHRLSTIRNADIIIALEDGRIREVGNHHELIAAGGLYSQLYQRQLELALDGAHSAG